MVQTKSDRPRRTSPPSGRQWARVISIPLVWAVHFTLVYALHSLVCHRGLLSGTILGIHAASFTLIALTVVAFAVILAAGWTSYRSYRRPAGEEPAQPQAESDAVSFLNSAGAILAGPFLLALVFTTLAIVMLSPCASFWW